MNLTVADLHLHSVYSDGDLPAEAVVQAAAERGIKLLALTDHNGLWGVDEAAAAAERLGLAAIEGIEVSVRWSELDIHVLGYSRSFDRPRLSASLAATRVGYERRAQEIVRLCQAAGYKKISFSEIKNRRGWQADPVYLSYDVAQELIEKYDLSRAQVRALTVAGGVCHVPYGSWALTIKQAVEVLHGAQGVAVLAHPGLIAADGGDLHGVLDEAVAAAIDGLEVYHPYHDENMTEQLRDFADKNNLKITGGSDWHGPGRYGESDARFGQVGLSLEAGKDFVDSLPRAVLASGQ